MSKVNLMLAVKQSNCKIGLYETYYLFMPVATKQRSY